MDIMIGNILNIWCRYQALFSMNGMLSALLLACEFQMHAFVYRSTGFEANISTWRGAPRLEVAMMLLLSCIGGR